MVQISLFTKQTENTRMLIKSGRESRRAVLGGGGDTHTTTRQADDQQGAPMQHGDGHSVSWNKLMEEKVRKYMYKDSHCCTSGTPRPLFNERLPDPGSITCVSLPHKPEAAPRHSTVEAADTPRPEKGSTTSRVTPPVTCPEQETGDRGVRSSRR